MTASCARSERWMHSGVWGASSERRSKPGRNGDSSLLLARAHQSSEKLPVAFSVGT
jgi:hypothetical protein